MALQTRKVLDELLKRNKLKKNDLLSLLNELSDEETLRCQ